MKTVSGYKLSTGQKRKFDLQSSGFNPYFGVVLACSVDFDEELLLVSIAKIRNDNDIFRLKFQEINYTPYPLQIVSKSLENDLQIEQYDNLYKKDLKRKYEEFYDNHETNPITIRRFILNTGENYLFIKFSALHFDGVAISNFIKTLNLSYRNPSLQLNNSFQFIQYSEWQTDLLSSPDNAQEYSFWENPLLLPSNDLKHFSFFLHRHPEKEFSKLSIVAIDIDNDILLKLQDFQTAHSYEPQCFFLSIWILLISQYSDNTATQIGVVENKRSYEEFNEILGPISRVLPFRIDISNCNWLSDVLNAVDDGLFKLLQLQEYFDQASIVKSDDGKVLNYQIGFEYLDFDNQSTDEELDFSITDVFCHSEPFLLKLQCTRMNNRYHFDIYYHQEIMISGGLSMIKNRFSELLKHIVETNNLNTPISLFSTMEPSAGFIMQKEAVNSTVTGIKFESITTIIEDNVLNYPLSVALKSINRKLTYYEFDEKASQLAHYISKRYKILKGNIVAVQFRNNIDEIICLLASLKVGAAFLPISSEIPETRLNSILEDSYPDLFITDIKDHLFPELETIKFADHLNDIAKEKTKFKAVAVTPNDIAYVIYTSGSTGVPKGVVINHNSLSNYVNWFVSRFNIKMSDHSILLSSLSFDLSYTSLWPALSAGSTVFTLQNSDSFDIIECMELIQNEDIAYLKLTPSHFNIIISNRDFSKILLNTSIRLIVLGGEKIITEDLSNFLSKKSEVQFVNHYGPTETTVGSIFHTITAENIDQFLLKPVIGSPIINTKAYILTEEGKPCIIGTIGEICIAGKGLAKGYLNNHEASKQKFCKIPSLNKLVYKTGDLGRLLPDGTIEFMGRRDEQVKINGFRVELEEIESVMSEHKKIKRAGVIHQKTKRNHLLIAYLECDEKLTLHEIRNWVEEKLPAYMIPANFIRVNQLPYKANGKINKSALSPSEGMPVGDKTISQFIPPSNELERILAKVWQEVLGIRKLGVTDDFYALGGDSIKALQIISKLYRLGLKLQIKDVLIGINIQGIASRITKLQNLPSQDTFSGIIPLTPIQIEFFEKITHNPNHFNQSALLSAEDIVPDLVEKVFDKLIQHHDMLRVKFTKYRNSYKQECKSLSSADYKFEIYQAESFDGLHESFKERATKIQSSINIEKGPLISLALFKSPIKDKLLIVIHHLLIDGVSWRILLEDFQLLYQQVLNCENFQLPFKSNSYNDWSEKLHLLSTQPEIKTSIELWNKHISEKYPSIPTDFGNQVATIENDFIIHFQLKKTNTANLMKCVQENSDFTYEEVLITALVKAIYKVLNINKLSMDIEKHGREAISDELDINRTVGWFTLRYPIFISGLNNLSNANLISEVSAAISATSEHHLNYSLIKYLMPVHEDVNKIKDFSSEICFNNLGQFESKTDQSFFSLLDEDKGIGVDPKSNKRYKIEITTSVFDGDLNIYIKSSHKHYKIETIENIRKNYESNLLELNKLLGTKKEDDNNNDFYLNEFSEDELSSLFD